ncbi:hypothetical protein [Anabaena sp. UHCC 0451]|uniref:hypothetical protein n=1 Tax=Anabaena sp. UHCC 0451 TaxID=2055235 RepID=UPI002B202818|nr:hypothetical protein [Anabaena sp. UHCC 0451]MEA5577733.1 hypothetical protein [Anabaena sp. UHCC 0451]
MNNDQLTCYMQEIAMHGLGAEIQFENFIQYVKNKETRQTRLVWSYLSSFLSHTAMISKFVSPTSHSDVKRRRKEALRKVLEINQASEVLSREARNNIEHFDERIDNWVEPEGYLEVVFPDKSTALGFMRDGIRIKRVLALNELIFFSENKDGSKFELELIPLFKEAKRIGDKATEWLHNSSPHNFIFPSDNIVIIKQRMNIE